MGLGVKVSSVSISYPQPALQAGYTGYLCGLNEIVEALSS